MSSKLQRAAFIAVAMMTALVMANAEGSGVLAQDNIEISGISPADIAAAVVTIPEIGPETEPAPRFIAREVVQPLPTDTAPDADTLKELVSEMSDGQDLSPDMMCLAQAIYFEARGEPLAGQLAVGRVIVNRTASDLFPDDYCGVVKQPAQFSFVRHGAIPTPRTGSRAWHRAVAIARIAHADLWHSRADDALFFHATRVKPRWANTKVARATIDSHIFYR